MTAFLKKVLSKQTAFIVAANIATDFLIFKLFDIEELVALFALMFVLLFSLCLCAVFYTYKKILFYCYLNVVISPLIFYAGLFTQAIYLNHQRYIEKTISVDKKNYMLLIHKQTGDYSIARLLDSNHTQFYTVISRNFVKHQDTIYLFYPHKGVYIHDDKLSGYPELKDSVLSELAKIHKTYL